jgi:TatD DNase family protein
VAQIGYVNAMELLLTAQMVDAEEARRIGLINRIVPAERLLIETDSPYLAPVPHRGRMNEPGWVRHVGEFIAKLRGLDAEAFATLTTDNFHRCFKVLRNYSHVE